MQIKTYKDYLDDLQNLYPHIDKKDYELSIQVAIFT